MKSRFLHAAAVSLLILGGVVSYGQSSNTAFTQTVNKAPTVTEAVPPSDTLLPGQSVTITSLVDTGLSTTGISAPSQTVTFSIDGTSIGTGNVSSASATNLLPFSSAFASWTPFNNIAAAPTISDGSVQGPDGVSNSASQVSFPDTTGGSSYSGFKSVVSGTSYAGLQLTFSIWTESSTSTNLTLIVADGSGGNAQAAITIPVGTSWQRFKTTVTLPSAAATGATVTLESTGATAAAVDLYGAQLEQASSAGVYVKTTGASETGSGAVATISTPFTLGNHTVTAAYSGDSNYLGSTSGALSVTVQQATATVAVASSLNPSVYGQGVTFTATVTGDGTPLSGGAVTVLDGGTAIGTCTLSGTSCTVSTNLLPVGSDSITAAYTGDPNYSSATSPVLTQVVQSAPVTIAVASSANPATYGDTVTLTFTVTGAGAIPSGTVTVVDALTGQTLGGGPLALDATGKATRTIATLGSGTHNLTITYGGNANYH